MGLDRSVEQMKSKWKGDALRTESVNGAEVWGLPSRKPHECDVLPQRLGNLVGGVGSLSVGIDDDLSQHLGMVAGPTTTGIGAVEDSIAQQIDRLIHNLHHVIRRDLCFMVSWQVQLVHVIVDVQKKPLPF